MVITRVLIIENTDLDEAVPRLGLHELRLEGGEAVSRVRQVRGHGAV